MVSGFSYFLQFKCEFGNKEFMIWAKEWKPQSQKTNQTDHIDHSFV